MGDKGMSVATYVSGGSAIIFGLQANELAALMGALAALFTAGVNAYYKRKHYVLAELRKADFPGNEE